MFKKYKPYILKYKALILKYVPCIFIICLMFSNTSRHALRECRSFCIFMPTYFYSKPLNL